GGVSSSSGCLTQPANSPAASEPRDPARPTSPSPTIEEALDSPRDKRSPTIAASPSIIVRATRARITAPVSRYGGLTSACSCRAVIALREAGHLCAGAH